MHDHALIFDPEELASHTAWIRELAARLVRDAADADDLVLETFLAALRRRPRRDRSLRPWLADVLRREAARMRRADRHRTEREELVASRSQGETEGDVVAKAETHRAVVDALVELKEPYREVLLLRYFEGLTPREIAQQQDVPGSTVRSQIERGLRQLREVLDDRSGGDGRAWALALVPFAVEARDPAAGPTTLRSRMARMSTTTKLVLTLSVFALIPLVLGTMATIANRRPGFYVPPKRAVAAESVEPAAEPQGSSAVRVPAGLAGRTEPPATGSPVQGRILHAWTGHPLVLFSVRLRSGELEEIVESDERGLFTTQAPFPPGKLTAEFLDHPRSTHGGLSQGRLMARQERRSTTVEWTPGESLELTTPTGPAFLVEWRAEVPLQAEELVAELTQDRKFAFGQEPLRGGFPSLVRFGTGPREPGPWYLDLRTPDGLWFGRSEVGELPTGKETPLAEVELRRVAALTLFVRREGGGPLQAKGGVTAWATAGAHLSRNARAGGWKDVGVPYVETIDTDLVELWIGGLDGTEADVRVVAKGFDPWEATVALEPGHETEVEVGLRPLREQIHVAGVIRSRSKTFASSTWLELYGGGAHPSPSTSVREFEERNGELVGTFAFDDVPPGEYFMSVRTGSSHRRWSGIPERIDGSITDLVITYEDLEPCEDLVFQIASAETRQLLPGAGYSYSVGSGGGQAGEDWNVPIEDVPLGAEVGWFAHAPGHVPFWGDESSFTRSIEVGRACLVLLEPGWGARFQAVDEENWLLLPGVRILIDGEEVAVTDANGEATVRRAQPPRTVELVAEGWELADTPFDPETGELRPDNELQVFWFRR